MEFGEYLRFVLALAFVVGLIILCAWFFRRVGVSPRIGKVTPDKRLSITELSSIDGKRRLALVRRDDVEHLILLGPERDLVIETGIATRNLHPVPESLGKVEQLQT